MKHNVLTVRQVETAKGPGRLADGMGLYLQISQFDTKAWVYRYDIGGKTREMGLGSARAVSLKLAREMARECREHLLRGDDPIEIRRAKRDRVRAAAAKRKTFAECADAYIAAHGDGWGNDKHRVQWRKTLEDHAFPVMGKLPVDAIDLSHVLAVLEPIWRDKTATASRLRGRIERVLAWATVRGYRKGENPARWRGHLKEMLPAESRIQKVRHHPALAVDELPAFMADLRQVNYISARALEFTILTAARTGEAIGARWDEIDFTTGVWSIPDSRMKAGQAHEVPLSGRVLELLASLPRSGVYVFPGVRAGCSLSKNAMLELLSKMKCKGTVHGFRSTFRDWAGDRTHFARDVIEHALAHQIKDKAEAAYRRTAALEKRRKLMEAWAQFCSAPATGANVTTLRRA